MTAIRAVFLRIRALFSNVWKRVGETPLSLPLVTFLISNFWSYEKNLEGGSFSQINHGKHLPRDSFMCFLFDVRIVCASNKTFWKRLNNGWYTESNTIQSSTRGLKSLLNKVPWVPKCPSGEVPKCLECRVHKYPSSVGMAQFPKCRCTHMGNCFECSSTQVPFECLWMSNFPLSALWEKKKSATLQKMESLIVYWIFKNFSRIHILHNAYCFLRSWK